MEDAHIAVAINLKSIMSKKSKSKKITYSIMPFYSPPEHKTKQDILKYSIFMTEPHIRKSTNTKFRIVVSLRKES